MKKSKMAQELTYLISEFAEICKGDEQFPHDCIGVRRKNAMKILDGLVELGMLPPFIDQAVIEHGDYFTMHVDQVVYNGKCEWEK